MTATPIKSPLSGEDLIGIEPELLQQVTPGWLHRLSLFTGRALSDTALDSEQTYRSGHLALLGQAVTPGIASGLELSVDTTVADPLLAVSPGYGLLANGEDVTLLSTLKTPLSKLPVLDASGNSSSLFGGSTAANTAAILVLQPIIAQQNGADLDTAPTSQLVSGNLDASCDQDPSEYAFEDLEIVDGCQLALVPWPSTTIPLPDPSPATTWRNRLAYAIFNAEAVLGPDDTFPWALLGLPLALVGFDASSKPLFVDRSAVVRQGGLPRARSVVPAQGGLAQPIQVVQPALAQARIAQLAEQIVQTAGITGLAADFPLLPPAGVLPSTAVDFIKKKASWFPPNWQVTAGPIHLEELETALLTGMNASPLDTTAAESVEILVPLPDAQFDPEILVPAEVDPSFQQAIDAATAARNITLQHRKLIQLAENALLSALGESATDPDAGLTSDEKAARDGASVYTAVPGDAYGTNVVNGAYISADVQAIQAAAAASPYTITVSDVTPAKVIPLFNSDDMADLTQNGVQHFIDRINAKLNRADDLVNLAFLTAQTDIYRYRQNVLGATDATRLATSPILANIATGDSADATAQNISTYLGGLSSALIPQPAPGAAAPAAPTGVAAQAKVMVAQRSSGLTNVNLLTSHVVPSPVAIKLPTAGTTVKTLPNGGAVSPVSPVTVVKKTLPISASRPIITGTVQAQPATKTAISSVELANVTSRLRLTETIPSADLTATAVAGTSDVQAQQPIVGAQLDIRTLTIAERLKQSPSQESLFYSVGNRLNLTSLLLDLEITVDDLQFVVDSPPSTAPPAATSTPVKIPTEAHRVYELRDATTGPQVLALMTSPHLDDDSDEAGLFSTGVRVLDQNTQLLRAVEARIQQYRTFLSNICQPALTSIQSNYSQAQAAVSGLNNDLDQERQNLAFTTALLSDETTRVNGVNQQRAATLSTYVSVVAYSRPSTLDTDADVPSRQLVPANVTSPVPACLGQPVTVPPELSEIVSLLREAPLSWFPSLAGLLQKIKQPALLTELAIAAQSRASFALQQPQTASSAAGSSGAYAPAIAQIFSTNQQNLRTIQVQRAAVPAAQFASLSWSTQVEYLKPVAAVADLISTSIVQAEIANSTARLVQQISSVATCLYTRVCLALPAERLQWAEYLRGSGISVQLNSLAILPGWNQQDYVDRQQMQLIADWLFQQIDTTNNAAVAYISDVIRVAILLASHAPVTSVIAGAVNGRTLPVVGGTVLLGNSSSRVTQGMHVQLYQAGQLTAEAVVSDLDSTSVTATVTKVHQSNVFLEDKAVAHFTSQSTDFAALKAFV